MIATDRRAAAALLALALTACGGAGAPEVQQPPITPPTQDCSAAGVAASSASALQTVCVLTSSGEFVVELDAARAPLSVANFLQYVTTTYYAQTIVHRVERTPLHVFQGGSIGIDATSYMFVKEPPRPAIALESANGLSNLRGTIAMARGAAADSAQAQFFLNVADNGPLLDYVAPGGAAGRDGYAVFGRVISGMEAVDRIGAAPTTFNSASYPELPFPAIVVYWAKQLK